MSVTADREERASLQDAFTDDGTLHIFLPHRWKQTLHLTIQESALATLPTTADLARLGAISSRSAKSPLIRHVTIAQADPGNPRNDTASVVELPGRKLIVVFQKYAAGPGGGNDYAEARVFSKTSMDGGLTWENERLLVDIAEGDRLVREAALCRLPSGEVLLACCRVHPQLRTTMSLHRSDDNGATFKESGAIWTKSEQLQLQGGSTSLVRLSSGRLVFPFHVEAGKPPGTQGRPYHGTLLLQ